MAYIKRNKIRFDYTECAHIIGQSTNRNLQDPDKKYAINAREILTSFGYAHVVQSLNGDGVHQLDNVLTLASRERTAFDRLELWLEPVSICCLLYLDLNLSMLQMDDDPKSHRYRVIYNDYDTVGEVEFHNHSSEPDIKMPSKEYIGLHASCAKIANLSGAVDVIEKWDREMDESDVLASDGSQVALLQNALMMLQCHSQDTQDPQDTPRFITGSA